MPDSTSMTAADLDAILARANAAEPGDWEFCANNYGVSPCYGYGLLDRFGGTLGVTVHTRDINGQRRDRAEDTAKFIVAARSDIPRMGDALQAAWERIKALEQEVERLTRERDQADKAVAELHASLSGLIAAFRLVEATMSPFAARTEAGREDK